MTSSPTLFEKLQTHFNAASMQYPAANGLFRMQLEKCRASLAEASEKPPHDLFFYKGICWRVGQFEVSHDEGEKMVKVFRDAEKLMKEHKGPRI